MGRIAESSVWVDIRVHIFELNVLIPADRKGGCKGVQLPPGGAAIRRLVKDIRQYQETSLVMWVLNV